jgi:hypothetical protein
VLEGRGLSGQEEPLVDIIAVHGLNASNHDKRQHGYGTWTKRDPKTKKDRLWLKDLDKAFPRARVLLEYYDASPRSENRYESFLKQSQGVLEDIRVKRSDKYIKASTSARESACTCLTVQQDPDRPIIFLMHSLGGLIIKQVGSTLHS